MDIKKAITKATGLPVGEVAFVNPPPLPYVIYLESVETGGADNINCIRKVYATVELYGCQIESEAESKIERALDEIGLSYDRDRSWIGNEEFFCTSYYNIEYAEQYRRYLD